MKLQLRDRVIEKAEPLVMGILNVTPDSFSDGGECADPDRALARAAEMVAAGVDIIDVGGESTRPGAVKVSVAEELARVVPVIRAIKKSWNVPVSVDTYKEEVARTAVVSAGADLVNDISGLRFDPAMGNTAARLEVPVVLMHILGTPENMQSNPFYQDVIAAIHDYFAERIDFALSCGICRERLILDPGIGFGKRVEDNIALIRHLRRFADFALPLLVGASRKFFLGKIAGESEPRRREAETIAAHCLAVLHGAAMVRVHDVAAAVRSLRVVQALRADDEKRAY